MRYLNTPFILILISFFAVACGEDPDPKKDIEPNNLAGNNQQPSNNEQPFNNRPGNNQPNPQPVDPQVRDWYSRVAQVACPRFVNECPNTMIQFESVNECLLFFDQLITENAGGCTIFNPVASEACVDNIRTTSCEALDDLDCDTDLFLTCP